MLVLVVARAIGATVRPTAAVRRPVLQRDMVGGAAWRDFDFGGERGRERRGQHEEGDGETVGPHAALWAGVAAATFDDAAADAVYRHSTLVIS